MIIEGYLTETKLSQLLQKIPELDWLGTEIPILETRYRWDMGFRYLNQVYYVEFDGDAHYRDPTTIRFDRLKDSLASKSGAKVVRIPYFIQLTTETFRYYFELPLDIQISQSFPHGFISKSAKLPSSFCKLGYLRYLEELQNLPNSIQTAVDRSLKNWESLLDPEYIY